MIEELGNGAKIRVSTIRARTWILTIAIFLTLILYFLMKTSLNENINIVDLVFISTIQITIHCIYFPDGELFGTKNTTFINNQKLYNKKANIINNERKVKELREYCEYEFKERQKKYIEKECGAIGITVEELEELKKLSPKQVKCLQEREINGKMLFFTGDSKKRLYKLIYKPLPLKKNNASTILSACENSSSNVVQDKSISYKIGAYIKKGLLAVVIAFYFAYIGYSFADGITFEKIVRLVVYLCSMMGTAVLSFTKGETCTKVYKNQFYIDLSNFISAFFQWLSTEKNIEIVEEFEEK